MIVKRKYLILLFIVLLISIVLPTIVHSANLQDAWGHTADVAGGAGYETAAEDASIEVLIAQIIQAVLSLIGVIFLILMIYGGYLWMTARGNEEQVTKAKGVITASLIGIIVVLGAYAISYFVISILAEGTLESGDPGP